MDGAQGCFSGKTRVDARGRAGGACRFGLGLGDWDCVCGAPAPITSTAVASRVLGVYGARATAPCLSLTTSA